MSRLRDPGGHGTDDRIVLQHVRVASFVTGAVRGPLRPERLALPLPRFRVWWLWLRLSHRFRWAHRPLCARFARDVLNVGGTFLCRSCACLYAGALATGALWSTGAAAEAAWTMAGPLLAPVVLAGSLVPAYQRLPRWTRDLLRLGAGALAVAALLLASSGSALGAAALALFAAAYAVIARQRTRRRATACDGCPELGRGRVCSGFTVQAGASRRLDAALQPALWGAAASAHSKGARREA